MEPTDPKSPIGGDQKSEADMVKDNQDNHNDDDDAEVVTTARPKAAKAPKAPKAKGKASKGKGKAPAKGAKAPKAPKAAKAAKAPAKGNARKAKAERNNFGFRKGSLRSQAAAMYSKGNGATLEEVKDALESSQLNLIKELEAKGYKVERKKEAGKGSRSVTRYKI